MKICKKLLLILAGLALALPAFFVAGNKNPVIETKADQVAYSTTFSGAETETQAYTDTYQWTFSEYINRVGVGGGIGFNLTKYTTSCTMTFKNALAAHPIKVTKVEIEVSSNPSDYEAANSASVYPSQGSSGSTKTITENEVKTTISQTFSGTSTGNVTIKLNNLYDGPNTIWVYSVKFYEAETSTMTITAGDGISSVYVSDNPNALSGLPSGSELPTGMVYAFGILEANYRHRSTWTKVSDTEDDVAGAIYRVGSYMNAGADHDFGTIDAIECKATVEFYDFNSDKIGEHIFRKGDEAYVTEPVEVDEYHVFVGWNSSDSWDGISYGTTITPEEINRIVMGIDDVTRLYAVWEFTEKLQNFYDKVVELADVTQELTPEYKALIDELNEIAETLTDGEKEVDGIDFAYEFFFYIWKDYVQLAIDNIGDVDGENFKENYERARDAYEEFPDVEYKEAINASPLEVVSADYVEILIDDIGEVSYTEECKNKIDSARHEYDALSNTQKESVDNYDVLIAAEARYEELKPQPEPKGEEKKGLSGGVIAGIVIGAVALALSGAYLLLFFLFNKWIIVNDKVVRVFRFGKKDKEYRLLTFKFNKQLRTKDLVFDKKKDAEEFLKNSK